MSIRVLARPAVAVATALAITASGSAPAAAAPPEAAPPLERASATVHPALVRVTGTFVAWVHDEQGVYANDGRPYTFTLTCSGFGVHPDGYLATAGHCVDANDRTVRNAFFRAAAEEASAHRPDIPLEQWFEYARSTFTLEGRDTGSPIQTEIRVSGIAGAPSDGVPARVVDSRPIGQGDLGLLKVDVGDTPALELAGAGIAIGTPLLAAGYPESVGEVVTPEAEPSIMGGAAAETHTDGGPVYEVDSVPEIGMSGGPAVDSSGRVLGITSIRANGEERAGLVVPISGFTDLLGRNGVTAELGQRDVLYREALDAYDAREYTDALDAIDRLTQSGPAHPRIDELRTDAAAAREQYGDASENRRTQIAVWVGVAIGVVVLLVVGAALLMRRRARPPVVIMGQPHAPFPGPQAPWPGGPGEALPQRPADDPTNEPTAAESHRDAAKDG